MKRYRRTPETGEYEGRIPGTDIVADRYWLSDFDIIQKGIIK